MMVRALCAAQLLVALAAALPTEQTESGVAAITGLLGRFIPDHAALFSPVLL